LGVARDLLRNRALSARGGGLPPARLPPLGASLETDKKFNYIRGIMSEEKKTTRQKRSTPPVARDVDVSLKKTPSGAEVWLFRAGGIRVNLTTSNSSASIMDDAVKIYSPALKRLAKR